MLRMPATVVLWLALLPVGHVRASGQLEARVQEIEQRSTAAPAAESDALIEALTPRFDELSPGQRQRVEFVRLRNRAVQGDTATALDGFATLLAQDLAPAQRLYFTGTAIHVAATAEKWEQAFTWLNRAMTHLPQAPEQSSRLLGAASYLYVLVGDASKARDLARRALDQVDAVKAPTTLCHMLSHLALAEDHLDNHADAETLRRRQIDACKRADNPLFVANGEYGVSKAAAHQGRHEEALAWAAQALQGYEEAGFSAGVQSARLGIARSLIALGRDLDRAGELLADCLQYYREHNAASGVAETGQLLADLAELRHDGPAALAHLKAVVAASRQAERAMRERQLAYLQVQFETELKEQQILLLQTEKKLAAAQATAVQRRQWLLAMGAGGLLLTAVLLSVLLLRSARERRRYRWQSEHDSLTGLYNYQQVRALGEASFVRARAAGRPFTAVMIDIDLFKQVNDRYGHAAGDAALRALGGWIRQVLEEDGVHGIGGRSGGDEFTLFLELDGAGTDTLLQRLRERIQPITVFGRTFAFHVSAGMAEAGEAASTLEQLVHEADQALYRAKHDGRDRTARTRGGGHGGAPGGSLVVVGSGIEFGRHASARCLSEIQAADVVFCLADPAALAMVTASRPDTISLGLHYAPGKDRRQTYREMEAAILDAVRAGQRVCAVFYGHPGVFADVPHRAIRRARGEGFPARMEPGISAEACLYADLGMDPGARGVQSLEATQFLLHDRQLDPQGMVLLWQVALSGDVSCTRTEAEAEGLQALSGKLQRWYPPDHEVILYEAAQLPIDVPRMERLALQDLPHAQYREYTTLVIPPLGEPRRDPAWACRTGAEQA